MKKGLIRVLVVEPGKAPYEKNVENKPETWKELVGGQYESGAFPESKQIGGLFYHNAHYKGSRFKGNRFLDYGDGHKDMIFGTFVIFGFDYNGMHASSLTAEQMNYYMHRFAEPEIYENKEQIEQLLAKK